MHCIRVPREVFGFLKEKGCLVNIVLRTGTCLSSVIGTTDRLSVSALRLYLSLMTMDALTSDLRDILIHDIP